MYHVQGLNTQVGYRRGRQVGVTLFHHSDWMRDRHVTASHHHKPQLVLLVTLEPHAMPCSGPQLFVLGLSLQTSIFAHLSAKLLDTCCSLSLNCSKHCHSQVVEDLVELS